MYVKMQKECKTIDLAKIVSAVRCRTLTTRLTSSGGECKAHAASQHIAVTLHHLTKINC